MQRSRLKNIINKSKTISNKQEIGNPFEEFKKSLPDNIKYDDNYRLEAAWKAYGSPKTYKEAIWEGLIQPIDENNYKLPSIGYNEETDEYEYLNKGQDNETVAKDIRVWDNDVIPLVQELKLGGYVRTFNEEKDCWTYTKNSQKKEEPIESGEQQTVIDKFQYGNKVKNKSEDELLQDEISKLSMFEKENIVNLVNKSNARFVQRLKDPNRKYIDLGNGEIGSHKLAWVTDEEGNAYIYPEIQELNGALIDLSENPKGAWITAKSLGNYVKMPSKAAASWFTSDNYKAYYPGLEKYAPEKFKQGGQMTTIPSGSLHARKNGMELAEKGEITSKGIPVVDNNGEQQAEIEVNEIIYSKSATETIEKAYKEYYQEETSEKHKDELAIKIGKFLTKEILENTDDKTGLIQEIAEKNNFEY